MSKRILSVWVLIGVIVLCGCPNDRDSDNKGGRKLQYDPDLDFFPDRVIVTLNREFGWVKPEYTPKDFPEFKFDKVKEAAPGTWRVVQQQLEAERTGNWEALQERIRIGMLLNLDLFERELELYLAEESKENVIKAVNLLKKRNDVQNAKPEYFPPLELGKLPNLDAKTELQMRADWLSTYENDKDVTVHHFWFDYYVGNYGGYEIVAIANHIMGGKVYGWERGKKSQGGRFYEVYDYEHQAGKKGHVLKAHKPFTENDANKIHERLMELIRKSFMEEQS